MSPRFCSRADWRLLDKFGPLTYPVLVFSVILLAICISSGLQPARRGSSAALDCWCRFCIGIRMVAGPFLQEIELAGASSWRGDGSTFALTWWESPVGSPSLVALNCPAGAVLNWRGAIADRHHFGGLWRGLLQHPTPSWKGLSAS